jgi:opacity protein-like surface antigen
MRLRLFAAVVLAMCCATAGRAATLRTGEYDGTLSGGTATLSLTVDKNPVSGNFRVAGASVTFQEPCSGLGTGTIFSSGWTWTPNKDFVNGEATILFSASRFTYIQFDAHLHERRISGPIEIINAVLIPETNGYSVSLCGRRKFQRAELDFSGPARFTPPPPGTAVQLLKPDPVGGAR